MSAGENSVPLDELLAHREWVRRLALAISRDEHEADDVEQATWVAALRRPPTHRTSLRGWLGTTVRRAAGRLRRAERRRTHHEAAVPPRTDAEDAAELATRADTHRRVVEALVALEEPLRRTLLLRYFEGLPVGEVALRTGVPLETCRARLRRGRAKLRERLERELGGRDALGAAVLLLTGREHGGGVAPAAGGVAMAATGTKVVAALAAAALIGAGLWWSGRDARAPSEAATALPVEAPRAPPVERARPTRAERPVAEVAPGEPASSPPVPPAPEAPPPTAGERLQSIRMSITWTDMGVLDAIREISERSTVEVVADRSQIDGIVADVKVHLRLDDVTATTVLRTLCKVSGLACDLEGPRVVIRRDGGASPDEESLQPLPRLAPLGPDGRPDRIAIRVVDLGGAPIEGADLFVPGSALPSATTGPGGEADIEARLIPSRVVARRPGSVDSFVLSITPAAETTQPVELRLRGPAARLRGTVRTRTQDPVGGAALSWTSDSERNRPADPVTGRRPEVAPRTIFSAADGAFDDRSAPPGPGSLRVAARGFVPHTLSLDAPAGSEAPVDVVPAQEAVCTGTVKTNDGEPVPRAKVTVSLPHDPHPLGSAVTWRDGTFRIVALPAGRVVVRIGPERSPRSPESAQLAETTVELTEGATTTWDPVINLSAK